VFAIDSIDGGWLSNFVFGNVFLEYFVLICVLGSFGRVRRLCGWIKITLEAPWSLVALICTISTGDKLTHWHAHTNTHTHMCPAHVRAHTHAHTHTHTHACTHARTNTCTHIHTHTHAHTLSHTRAHTRAHTHAKMMMMHNIYIPLTYLQHMYTPQKLTARHEHLKSTKMFDYSTPTVH
jgi:hypothetical protein